MLSRPAAASPTASRSSASPVRHNVLTLDVDTAATRLNVPHSVHGRGHGRARRAGHGQGPLAAHGPQRRQPRRPRRLATPPRAARSRFTGVGRHRRRGGDAATPSSSARSARSPASSTAASRSVSGLIDSLSIIGLNGGAYTGLISTAQDTTRKLLDHKGKIELIGGTGTLMAPTSSLDYVNLEPISVLAPVADVTILGNENVPDAYVLTAINLSSIVSG